MYICKSTCTCGLELVGCELEARERIGKHYKEYDLEEKLQFPYTEWPARCRRCGRTYMVHSMGGPDERATLYPWFFYHTIISWNQVRRHQANQHQVTLDELHVYWRRICPEIDWEAGMANAFEYDQTERKRPRRSFVYGAPWYKLEKYHAFRREHDLALEIPFISTLS